MDTFPHDASYKAFFSDQDMMKSLLADFLPKDLIRDFNLDTLEICSGSYVTEELSKRQNDVVWRVKYKDDWCYIYILLEFQSTQDPKMALRILTYTALLWEDLIKNGTLKATDKLPPVLPIVLYNGENRWTAKLNVNELVEQVPSPLSDYQPSQKYLLIDENRINDLLLDKAQGTAAYIFRFERVTTREEVVKLSKELRIRLNKPENKLLLRLFQNWMRLIFKRKGIDQIEEIDDMEGPPMLEQTVARWEKEILQEGILKGEEIGFSKGEAKGKSEGISEGIAKGLATQKATLIEMLSNRFGKISSAWQNALNEINDPHAISQLTINLLKVNSADEYDRLLMDITNLQ